MEITWDATEEWLIVHGLRIVASLSVGIIAWFVLTRFIKPIVLRTVRYHNRNDSEIDIENRTNTLTAVIIGGGKALVAIIILFMILEELDVPVGPVLAGFGIAGIAIGFGAQYLIKDLIAGAFIIMENQYRVGDWARIGEVHGLVEEVNLRKTVIRDWEGLVHHIPNGNIEMATNMTRQFGRVNFLVPVAYGTDLDHAIEVINRVGNELASDEKWQDRIISPPQALRVDNFGDSGIDIKIYGDVNPRQQWAVMGELRLRLKKAFDNEGIEIPWPHTKVFFGNELDRKEDSLTL